MVINGVEFFIKNKFINLFVREFIGTNVRSREKRIDNSAKKMNNRVTISLNDK